MLILKIDVKRLRNEEWFSFFTELRALVKKYGAAVLGIAALFELLETLLNRADRALIVLRKSVHTAEMKNADKERNDLFRGLYETVKVSRKLTATADREAAERLSVLLSGYRKTALDSSYAEETSAIYNLLQDLKGPYAADITQLGLGKWVTDLQAAEARFLACLDERSREYTGKPVEDLRKIRSEADALYRSITEVVYARLLADGLGGDVAVDPDDIDDGTYESSVPPEQRGNIPYKFVIAWNPTVRRYHNMLASRAGRRAAAQHPDSPDMDTDPDTGEGEEA
jgi:hypothetical protein